MHIILVKCRLYIPNLHGYYRKKIHQEPSYFSLQSVYFFLWEECKQNFLNLQYTFLVKGTVILSNPQCEKKAMPDLQRFSRNLSLIKIVENTNV